MAVQKKHRYVHAFGIVVIVLALVRCALDGKDRCEGINGFSEEAVVDTLVADTLPTPSQPEPVRTDAATSPRRVQPIRGVLSYSEAFPDSNHVQLLSAQQWGVSPVKNRLDAEQRKSEVVYVGSSPYYDVAPLNASIPYLVPHAAVLLQDIGVLFFDSLYSKGLPLHRIVVSSVLRTEDDVARLRRSNHNATEQSCHLYGTTFDINYNAYTPVDESKPVGNDKLKYVLCEVLRDLRQQGRCYIKYEVRQPCFHITVR